MEEIQILFEDADIIVCIKPAGVPTQSDRTGDYDLTNRLLNHLALKKENKQAEVPYLAVIHRLDRPVGGIMVFAKNKSSAAALSKQVQEHRMTKRYLCVLTGASQDMKSGGDKWNTLTDYLRTDKRTNLSRRVSIAGDNKSVPKDAKKAELSYRVLEQITDSKGEQLTLTEVELLTGRHHQIRVQMTGISQGIWGDTKYNTDFAEKKGWYNLALFSHELSFVHPTTGQQMHFTSSIPFENDSDDVWHTFHYTA